MIRELREVLIPSSEVKSFTMSCRWCLPDIFHQEVSHSEFQFPTARWVIAMSTIPRL
jgi:hypothetical protein